MKIIDRSWIVTLVCLIAAGCGSRQQSAGQPAGATPTGGAIADENLAPPVVSTGSADEALVDDQSPIDPVAGDNQPRDETPPAAAERPAAEPAPDLGNVIESVGRVLGGGGEADGESEKKSVFGSIGRCLERDFPKRPRNAKHRADPKAIE